jgi:RNA polymerase sigma factor (TIGR02999 family)
LVHEAYLRLVDTDQVQRWNSRGHFFAAAAEAMRRILIDSARSKACEKRGGDWQRVDFEELDIATAVSPDQLVALDDALVRLAAVDHLAGELVKFRYFAGLALGQAAAALGISTATAYRHWAYARAWLRSEAWFRMGRFGVTLWAGSRPANSGRSPLAPRGSGDKSRGCGLFLNGG